MLLIFFCALMAKTKNPCKGDYANPDPYTLPSGRKRTYETNFKKGSRFQ